MNSEVPGPTTPAPRPRYAVLDMVRGVAILGVVAYHLAWDLSYFRFYAVDVTLDPPWVVFARLLASTFLFLVGAGLVLAHGERIRWRAFWRRFAVVAGAALAVTVVTYVAFPATFVSFGILHAIAAFSLAGLPFLRAPLAAVAVIAGVFLILPQLVHEPLFSDPNYAWIGLWTVPPPANDLVPIFPSFGIVLLGILAARLVLRSRWREGLAAITARGPGTRFLAAVGRWTLIIYLVHQPLLLAVVYPLAQQLRPAERARASEFVGSCRASCEDGEQGAAFCTRYCACALGVIEDEALWDVLNSGPATPQQQGAIASIYPRCTAAARDGMPAP